VSVFGHEKNGFGAGAITHPTVERDASCLENRLT